MVTKATKFLTTDEVLTALFDSDNDSDGSEISFGDETTSSEEFVDVVPTLVDETKLDKPCFWDSLLDIDVSCLFCFLCSFTYNSFISIDWLRSDIDHIILFKEYWGLACDLGLFPVEIGNKTCLQILQYVLM